MTRRNIRDDFPIYHTNWLNRIAIIDEIQSVADSYSSGLLLDVGCGIKPYQELFIHKVKGYLGLDLRLSDLHFGGIGPDMMASALRMPLCDNTVDTVVSFQVLEHVCEPQTMFVEMYRVLKPDGYLILMAPQMWHLHEIPNDYFRYTRYGLEHLAKRAGFTVVDIRPISGFWHRAGLVFSYRLSQLFGGNAQDLMVTKYVIRAMIAASNLTFCLVGRLWPRPYDPINNLLIAKKCKQSR